ncbi:MAG: helix-turn-helix transcriptional regulator [Phycisphaeraceae bacterium]|nr:helix-turn-helix transcriptional regulator [Phycisphaeraceae bacterium]
MARKWKDLKAKMSRATRERVDARVKQSLESMPLAEIRKAIGMTQAELAEKLDNGQGNVSKLENSADMYLTTLRKYIEALGGELHLTATFSGGRKFEIDQVSALGDSERKAG